MRYECIESHMFSSTYYTPIDCHHVTLSFHPPQTRAHRQRELAPVLSHETQSHSERLHHHDIQLRSLRFARHIIHQLQLHSSYAKLRIAGLRKMSYSMALSSTRSSVVSYSRFESR